MTRMFNELQTTYKSNFLNPYRIEIKKFEKTQKQLSELKEDFNKQQSEIKEIFFKK
jgi:uncharacterized membrane-anchored protein YhcB (DUF1043 family)